MDAGWVNHLLAQVRPAEDPICPRLSEECGAEAPWDVLATGTPRTASWNLAPIRPLCWIWHHLAGIAREPWTMEQLKWARLLEVGKQSMWSWKSA